MAQTADITIDYSGMTCPTLLVGAKKALDDLAAGQMLRLISDCSGTHDDLLSWCNFSGNELVATDKDAHGTAYLLRKAGSGNAKPVPHVSLDMRGVACPGPILQAKRLLQGMHDGEILQLVTDCTAAVDDVPVWGQETAIDLLYQREIASGVHEFYLRKH
jgi:TusA-related sulfurtransferase